MSDDKQKDDIIDIEPQIVSDEKPIASKRRGSLSAGIIVGVALLAAMVGMWLYRDYLAGYLPNDQVQALSMRVDALEAGNKDAVKRVDAIIALTDELKAQLGAARAVADKSAKESADLVAQNQSTNAAISDVKQALDQTKADLETVKSQLTSGTGNSDAADPALGQRLEALEKAIADLKGAPPAVLDVAGLKQTLAALDAKIANGTAFENEYSAIAAAVPAADGLDVLKTEAAKGVANSGQLAEALRQISAQMPKPQTQATTDSWFDKIGNFFSGLVTIKTVGADDWSTIAAKCSALVAAGDLQQADALFSGMEGQPPTALAAWHDTLQRRIKLDDALSKVNAAVAREIAAKG